MRTRRNDQDAPGYQQPSLFTVEEQCLDAEILSAQNRIVDAVKSKLTTAGMTTNPALLSGMLLWVVSERISRKVELGGPKEEDYERIAGYVDDLASGGDSVLYREKKRGQSAHRFNQFAEVLSILAFHPGGIDFGGEHYDARAQGWKPKGETA
jgi:hypothetical protein